MAMAPSRATADSSPLSWVSGGVDGDDQDRQLLILLHGAEDDPADMLGWTETLDPGARFHSVAAGAPFGPVSARTWFSSTPRGPAGAEVRSSLIRLRATIDQVRGKAGVSADPAVVVGYSQGGAMALLLAADLATNGVVAAVSVCGWLPDVEGRPEPASVEARFARPCRVLVLNARDDQVVPIDFGEAAAVALRSEGLTVDFLEVEGGHHPGPEVLAAAGEWLSRPSGEGPGAYA